MPVTIYLPGPPESAQVYGPLNRELGVGDGNLPDGLLHHYATQTGDSFNIFEIWESREQFERFAHEQLLPALDKLAGEHAPQIEPVIGKLYNEFRA
jgi:hypothetical protein